MEACEEDEDVVLKGSALHQHLVSSGYESELEIFHQNESGESEWEPLGNTDSQQLSETGRPSTDRWSSLRVLDLDYRRLVENVAQQALSSLLLVDEDVDFLKKFLHLDLDDLAPNPSVQPCLLVLPGGLGSLCLLSSSPVWRLLGLTSALLTVGLSSLQLRKCFLLNRIVNTYTRLLASGARLKSVLNEV